MAVLGATTFLGPSTVLGTGSGTDTTPPAAPTGLVATGGAGFISLDWADNTEPDLNLAEAYIVERATASAGPYTQIATTSSSNYIDFFVTSGVTYFYRVRAQDNAP